MAWVLEHNEATRAELRELPSYRRPYDETLDILTSTDRIAQPKIRGEHIYNFWSDVEHPRGVCRRTSLPPQFDAEGLVTEQHFANSPDGTRVPYFAVRADDVPMDGSKPRLLYA
jgi:prolyl oligopeptidase PreP (S9A serine peptidase family)